MNDDPQTQMAYVGQDGLKQGFEAGQLPQAQGPVDGKPEYPSHTYSMPNTSSPPNSASPFAFAPPPLSSLPGPGSSSRPSLMHSHHYSDGPYPKAHPQQQQPFPGGHPHATFRRRGAGGMGSLSPGLTGPGGSPRAAVRQPSLNSNLSNGSNTSLVPSISSSSPYPPHYFHPQHQRQVSGPHESQYQNSPNMSHMGPPGATYGPMYRQPFYTPMDSPYTYAPSPSYVDHPGMQRAPYSYLGPPSSFGGSQPPHLLPSISAPSNLGGHGYGGHLPPLARHQSSSSMLPDALSSVHLASPGLSGRPPLLQTSSQPALSSYSFAARLPLSEKPFKCDECVQGFNRNHDLKRHKRIHLSVKPFGCDKCGKTFSRKDALRRHWLVKGCRGEDGATAKISPNYPLNGPPPALDPPTPEAYYTGSRAPTSFSHPAAPPPLPLPPRQPSDQSTTILTPEDAAGPDGQPIQSLQEPVLLTSGSDSDMANSVFGEEGEGYFDGAVVGKEGIRQPYYPPSPSQKTNRVHPYARSPRPEARFSPSQSPASGGRYAGESLQQQQEHPIFAMPFSQSSHYGAEPVGLMVTGPHAEEMSRQQSGTSSQGDDPAYFPRWHRPSFPFPPPVNSNFNEPPVEFVEPATA